MLKQEVEVCSKSLLDWNCELIKLLLHLKVYPIGLLQLILAYLAHYKRELAQPCLLYHLLK